MKERREVEAEHYQRNVGRPHTNLPADHPDRCTREERVSLMERLEIFDEPVLIEGQEEMVV